MLPALLHQLATQAEAAFIAVVRRTSPRRLEQTLGAPPALRVLFAAMASRYVPERAEGFTGDLQFDLRAEAGDVRSFTVSVLGATAAARPGPSAAPALTLSLSVADFLHLAAGELDPVEALLAGRMDLEGDFAVALRVPAMFGR